VQRLYGEYDNNRLENRSVFVIAPDGRIAHYIQAFSPLSAQSYTTLAAEIDKLSPPQGDSNR
jgi:hypothetical protein